jgi:hypothetical protein
MHILEFLVRRISVKYINEHLIQTTASSSRSYQFLGSSRNSLHSIKPEGSLTRSKKARHRSLSWAQRFESKSSPITPLKYIWKLFFHLCLGLQNGYLSFRYSCQNLYDLSNACYLHRPSHPPCFYHPYNNEEYKLCWNSLWYSLPTSSYVLLQI